MSTILLIGMPGMGEWVIIGLFVLIFFGAKKIPEFAKGLGKGIKEFKDAVKDNNLTHQEILSPSGDLAEAARALYAALHRLDKLDLDVIIAERFLDNGLGKTINDRLQRAVEK